MPLFRWDLMVSCRVQRSFWGFVGLLAPCSAAAFSLFSNGILAAPLAHHSSASAPDFHRLPLFSPGRTGSQSLYSVFRQKKKPHGQTFCLCDRLFSRPAFLQPISGLRFGAHTWSVFWLAHHSGFLRQRPHPAFSGFPNDRIAPLRVRTFAHTATGIAPGLHRIP